MSDPYSALPARPIDPARFTAEDTYRHTRLPVDLASTLIPDAYCSPEFFALERERVFASSWVAVGLVADVDTPGRCVVVEVAGRSIIVTRNRHGALRGFHNVCRHRATKLLDGDAREVGRHHRIRCPYHSWTYDTDGACLGTPLFEGSDVPAGEEAVFDTVAQGFDKADHGLLPVSVACWGFFLFVNLSPDPEPLPTALGDLPRAVRRLPARGVGAARRRTVRGRGELQARRRELHGVLPPALGPPRAEPGLEVLRPLPLAGPGPLHRHVHHAGLGQHRRWRLGRAASAEHPRAGRRRRRPLRVAVPLDRARRPAQPRLRAVQPPRRGRPHRRDRRAPHPPRGRGTPAEDGVEQLAKFWDLVNRQDLEIVERVQEGLANPAYRGGRMCFRFEEPLHRFQNMVIDKMVGLDRVPGGDDDTMARMFPDP